MNSLRTQSGCFTAPPGLPLPAFLSDNRRTQSLPFARIGARIFVTTTKYIKHRIISEPVTMMHGICVRTTIIIRRVVRSHKRAVFYVKFLVVCIASVFGMGGILKVPPVPIRGPASRLLHLFSTGRPTRATALFSAIHSH
jgi:hypothetical protein